MKGGVYENHIADIMIKKGLPLKYYKSDNSEQEIEFLITQNSDIIPVEVKAGNGASVSLNWFLQDLKPPIGYKFISGNVGVVGNKVTMPLYMAMFL